METQGFMIPYLSPEAQSEGLSTFEEEVEINDVCAILPRGSHRLPRLGPSSLPRPVAGTGGGHTNIHVAQLRSPLLLPCISCRLDLRFFVSLLIFTLRWGPAMLTGCLFSSDPYSTSEGGLPSTEDRLLPYAFPALLHQLRWEGESSGYLTSTGANRKPEGCR